MTSPAVRCRSCREAGLVSILDLGRTPLANALLSAEQLDLPEPTYPLELVRCPHCSLVQILETVPPQELFGEYLYFSSFSQTMLDHARSLTAELTASRHLGGDSLVIEAASNDGYLLQFYRKEGVPVLGVEPARNIAEVARRDRGIPTLAEFFGADLGRRLRDEGRRADVFHGHNVLAHVADLNGFVEGIRLVLRDDGVAVVEAPYIKDLIDKCEFDTIYHEHLCYFSLTALDRLFQRHGLVIHDVRRVAIHGGSLRLYASPAESNCVRSEATTALLAEEAAWGVDRPDFYLAFVDRVKGLRETLCCLLTGIKKGGKRVAGYGASAKGSTLLNYFGVGRETLDFVVDRSTVKQGKYTPGTHLAIHEPARLLEEMPDYLLLLTWNFADEIVAQQAEYRHRGGRFIIPIPTPKVA